jgi:hypothetical protein
VIVIPNSSANGGRERDLTSTWLTDAVARKATTRCEKAGQPPPSNRGQEDRRNEPARMRERRRVTNHLAVEKGTPVLRHSEADPTDIATQFRMKAANLHSTDARTPRTAPTSLSCLSRRRLRVVMPEQLLCAVSKKTSIGKLQQDISLEGASSRYHMRFFTRKS